MLAKSSATPQSPGEDPEAPVELSEEELNSHLRQSYGSRWHTERRQKILEKYPEVRQLVETHHGFLPTVLLAFVAAAIHFFAITSWVPNIWRWAYGYQRWSLRGSILTLPMAVLVHGPVLFLPEVNTGAHGTLLAWLCINVVLFGMAYTVGAWCRMAAFAVGHEVVHEAIHPWLCTNGTAPEDRGVLYCVRFLLKDMLLRIGTFPSVGCTIFEYYHNQHLAHHQFLGGKDFGINLRRMLDGSQSGDGDQLSVNTLLYKQRMQENVEYRPVQLLEKIYSGEKPYSAVNTPMTKEEREEQPEVSPVSISFIMRSFRVEDYSGEGNKSLASWAKANPIAARLVLDPLYHIAHFVVMNALAMLELLALSGWLVLLFLTIAPQCVYSLGVALGRRVTPHFEQTLRRYTIRRASWWLACKQVWPQASVGLQQIACIVFWIWVLVYFSGGHALVRPGGVSQHFILTIKDDPVTNHPVLVWISAFTYASLAEMFLFGFLFHPFLAYFLAVHQSAYKDDATGETVGMPSANTAGTGAAEARPCQPTRSIYSTFLSICTCNLNYHVEHHDFPSIPWFYLPRIKKMAPEFYATEDVNAQFHSCYEVISKYVKSRSGFVYGCSDQFSELYGAPRNGFTLKKQ